MLEKKTDEELMLLYQNGSEEAFQALYSRHSSKIFGYVKSRIKNREEAQELFQEVFVKIHKSKHLYNRTFPVLPWIFTVTKNALIDRARAVKVKEEVLYDVDLIAAPEVAFEAGVSNLSPVLSELSNVQRKAIELRYLNDQSFEEISKVLKTSPLNVRKIVSRGVQQLRALMQEKGEKP